jgi:diguanylate cyclase (GGDEF)-like protein/PAS domain S-box-containing protein
MESGLKLFSIPFDQAQDSIFIVGRDTRIKNANVTACRHLGYSKDELLALNISDIEPDFSMQSWENLWSELTAIQWKRFETRHKNKDGTIALVEITNRLSEIEGDICCVQSVRDITERIKVEQSLKLTQASLDHSNEAFFRVDANARIRYVNEAACQHLGYSKDELLKLGITDINPDFSMDDWQGHWGKVSDAGAFRFEARHKRKDGVIVPVEIVATSIEFDGKPHHFSSVRDISERKALEESLRQSETDLRLAAAAFETHEAIMITNAENNSIIRVNGAFERITGYSASEVLGKNPKIMSSGRHDRAFYEKLWHRLLDTGSWSGEIWDKHKDGKVYPKWLSISAVKNEAGATTHYVANFSDISEWKHAEELIQKLAFNDALTDLPNRRMLLDRLNLAIMASVRSQQYGALLYLDMDNFKTINDSLGHEFGDAMLIEVANRLNHSVRETDTVARLGGDEFVVLMENICESEEEASKIVAIVAEKIRSTLSATYRVKNKTFHSSPSIGACLFSNGSMSVDDLLKHADIAMYQAKSSGKNKTRFFDPKLQQIVAARAALEADLRNAIANQQLHLYYQIQVNDDGLPVGAEALIRWMHPERGMVSPADFIPLAEESSLILEIGNWVLENACQQLVAWSKHALTKDLVLAVNISANQFKEADFVEQVATVLRKYGAIPSRLKLELTESIAINKIDSVATKMFALRQLVGVTLSLDDFGTGYSSLSYLKLLPFNQLKIDQSFVRHMLTEKSDAMMVRTIIEMAKNFKLDVIAEGVETDAQLAFLRQHNCMTYQGYLFSKPIPIEKFEELLSNLPWQTPK